VKKLNLGSNLTSISLLSSIASHLISYACLLVDRFFSVIL